MEITSKRRRSGDVFLRTAIAAVVASTFSSGGALAQEQDEAKDEATKLDTIEVTGSRIRRVDAETASPVFTIDRKTIESSGVTTIGELLQDMPSVSGAATNPQVNNGGGDGAAEVELRGLDSTRTLILLNGRRVVTRDVNVFPINLIERVEVLKEGAGAIYGSDAIGGVVNFITRRDYNGGDISVDVGVSGEGDGKRRAVSLSWGATNDKSSLMLGLNYNQQDGISAGDRKFSEFALYLYGSAFAGGSSRAPNGRISLPDTDPNTAGVQDPFGFNCASGSVTRIDGAAGSALSDFRCFETSGANPDFYNYQPLNLILTPQERASIFSVGSYELSDNIELYSELFHNFTTSGFQIAPLPFDARSDNVLIPANNVYNPFGIDFGGQGAPLPPNALWRMEALGNRLSKTETVTDQINLGLRGGVLDTTWRWDLTASYGRYQIDSKVEGYLFKPGLTAAFGPSFDTDPAPGIQNPVCGTAGPDPNNPSQGATIVQNCTPVNIFNLEAPGQADALSTISSGYNTKEVRIKKGVSLAFTGNLFQLPAGMAQGAFGAEWLDESLRFDIAGVATGLPPLFNTCNLSSETCSGDLKGDDDQKELYGEVLLPVLAGKPGVESLNLIAGVRWSDYDSAGSTTNFTGKIEYRPITDLMVRASYAEVFRVAPIDDRFSAPTSTAATFNDPCVGLTAAQVAANPNLALACENVPQDGTFTQANGQVDGLITGNPDVAPEEGDVLTYGFVYDPGWLPNFSASVDFWRYELENTLDVIDVNTTLQDCAATGDTTVCDRILRFSDGSVQLIYLPLANLGTLETSGVDVGLRYALNKTPVGAFNFSLDTTYIEKYDSVTAPGAAPIHVAGTFDRQYGNYARVRSMGAVRWDWNGFEALWAGRYIHGVRLHDPDGAPGTQPDLFIGSHTYHDFAVGYTYEPWRTGIQVGVENAFDKQPPILYQNNVTNANTDVETYDTVGRYYFVRLFASF